jgi:hypothetical protein
MLRGRVQSASLHTDRTVIQIVLDLIKGCALRNIIRISSSHSPQAIYIDEYTPSRHDIRGNKQAFLHCWRYTNTSNKQKQLEWILFQVLQIEARQ